MPVTVIFSKVASFLETPHAHITLNIVTETMHDPISTQTHCKRRILEWPLVGGKPKFSSVSKNNSERCNQEK